MLSRSKRAAQRGALSASPGGSKASGGPGGRAPGRVLLVALAVTAWVTFLSWIVPWEHAGTAVGVTFFAVTYWCVLRGPTADIEAHGLALGGVFGREPLNPRRILSDLGTATRWCGGLCLVCFPPFLIGYRLWFDTAGFAFSLGSQPLDLILGHLLAVALPEEMFYRGYLQSRLDRIWTPRLRVFGAMVGPGLLVSCTIFALGHFTTTLQLTRLSVFFPALLFGWLRAKTGGIGAAVLFHAACNLFSAGLARGYGLVTD
jgi:uncharacterized protein